MLMEKSKVWIRKIQKDTENKTFKSNNMNRADTHIVFGILVGIGIDQQPCTVRVTIHSGTYQRCRSALRVEFAAAPLSATAS
jgi:recombination DNA repair RAD52 pathway protein